MSEQKPPYNVDPPVATSFACAKDVQAHLQKLRDEYGLTWTEIAQRPVFCNMPIGTVYDIFVKGRVPTKWRKHLGIKSRPRISIHKEDMTSAYNTIVGNLPFDKVRKLAYFLLDYVEERED